MQPCGGGASLGVGFENAQPSPITSSFCFVLVKEVISQLSALAVCCHVVSTIMDSNPLKL